MFVISAKYFLLIVLSTPTPPQEQVYIPVMLTLIRVATVEENANMEASCEQQSGWYELPVACTSRAEKRLHYTELSLHVNKKSLPLLEEIRIPENFLILLHSGMYEVEPGRLPMAALPTCRRGRVLYTSLALTGRCRVSSL